MDSYHYDAGTVPPSVSERTPEERADADGETTVGHQRGASDRKTVYSPGMVREMDWNELRATVSEHPEVSFENGDDSDALREKLQGAEVIEYVSDDE